jgi:hypothetical protein
MKKLTFFYKSFQNMILNEIISGNLAAKALVGRSAIGERVQLSLNA